MKEAGIIRPPVANRPGHGSEDLLGVASGNLCNKTRYTAHMTKPCSAQRIRQAYDEFARPARMAMWLSVLPAIVILAKRRGPHGVAAAAVASIAVAETGRRIGGGTRVFSPAASLAAPLWLAERSIAAWLAVVARLVLGGVPYRGRIVRAAATPLSVLRRRYELRAARGERPAAS